MSTENNLSSLGEDLRRIEKEYKEKIEPYRTDLWYYCYRLTNSPWDAEDLVQETLLKSLSMLSKVFQELNTKAYLFRIASNIWIDQHRKRKLDFSDGFSIDHVHSKFPYSDFELMENLQYLAEQLTPKQYISLILVDVLRFTAAEAGQIIGSTKGAVSACVQRAREVLREAPQNSEADLKKNAQKIESAGRTMDVLLEGFRKKDPGLIASLLHEDVVTEITHAGVEYGRKETIKNSLRDWLETVQAKGDIFAYYYRLWGKNVVVEAEQRHDGLYLNNIHSFEEEEDRIVRWKFYCFSWELLNLAAEELGLKLNAENFQHIF